MLTEEKQLLLRDLCARLLYGVKCNVNFNQKICVLDADLFHDTLVESVSVKPYLRPMSSMTEEEKKEFTKILVKSQDCSYENNESATTIVNDWYLSKGFDVRGLIPKGLALEAPDDMYK